MHRAVLGARPAVLRFLLEKRAWAEGADGADDTPLHLAARRANPALRLLTWSGSAVCLRGATELQSRSRKARAEGALHLTASCIAPFALALD